MGTWMRSSCALAAAIVLTGCGSPGPEIKGVVTFDGKPMEGARLMFEPLDAHSELGAAIVKTDATGAFKIEPRPDTGETLKPGKYAVSATRKTDAQGNVPSEADYGQLEAAGQLRDTIPTKYMFQPGATPTLSAEIKEGDNELKFDLTSK